MKINSISAMPMHAVKKASKSNLREAKNNTGFKVVSMSEYMSSPLSFKGRNKEQAIFYGAEVAPYSKAGGVGVVMKDYGFLLDPKDEVVVSPYYRADVNRKTGKVTPAKDAEGNYILHTNGGDLKLDLIAEKTMQWGKNPSTKIMLFNLRDEEEKIHYFVFDDATAHYTKPYEGGVVYASGAKGQTNAWNGDPYAKNSRAFVELLPELIASKKDFNPATIVCSDSQTAYTHEYIVQKAADNEKGYDGIKTTHIGHNLGPGYCGETSMQNMFVNLGATPEQIEMVESDPIFKQGLLGDKYFQPFVQETLDETGTASATQIALHHANKGRANGEGFVKAFSVVAEDYAESIATNPQAAHNIHKTAKKLFEDGVFSGILNPLEDPSIDATKKLPNARYNEDCVDTDGTVHPAFEIYPKNCSYEEMRAIKNRNKLKLFERFSASDNSIITGDKNRKAGVNPEAQGVYDGPTIRPELIDLIKQGKGDEVPLFITWGRLDTQKGFDIAIEAFEKFAKTPEGKNAVFILGAGIIKGSDESKRVEDKMTEMLKDPELQGRVVHVDGWAPVYALASAADAAIFTSRFEPCGLTDIEAMKYYCTPIVTNTQGFKQKNFDPRIVSEREKATSFKTQHEFDLLKSQVELILDAYLYKKDGAIDKVKDEFPCFYTTDEEGNKVYDDSLFVTFANDYSEFIEAQKNELSAKYDNEKKFPKDWNDWDKFSKEYSFKYAGFARDLKDGILKAETAQAISAFMKRPEDLKAKMFENLKALRTDWKGNANLHPTNESSYEMYKKLHMDPEYSKPTEFDVIAKSDKFVEKTIQREQETDMATRAGKYTIGAILATIPLMLTRINKAGLKGPDAELNAKIMTLEKKLLAQEELKSRISMLEHKLEQTKALGKKNMIIAAVASAVGGIALALIGTAVRKKLESKKAEAKAKEKVATTPVVAQEVKAEETKKEVQPTASSPIEPKGNLLFSNFAKYM